ncbi:MAG: ABC transporter permease [Candidatus Aminicenantes bacterium]|nr:MAG: ABC transporter permease [Candidatus Aminicenantes bacterium]
MLTKNKQSSSVLCYSPESRIRHPLKLFREMWRDLLDSRELAWRLIVRDISAQYRQTFLGYFWAIFPPLVICMVFILLNASRVIQIEDIDIPYAAYVFIGTVFWQVFVDALNVPLKVVKESKAILTKVNFPRESLILSGIGQVLFSFGIKCILLIGVLLLFRIPVKWTIVFIPLPLIGLLLLGTMLGIFLLPLGLLYKDVQSALLIATSGLVFVTPVAYPSTMGGTIGKIMQVNPVTPLLEGIKHLILRGVPADLSSIFLIFLLTIFFLFLGWVLYRLALPIVIERIGA